MTMDELELRAMMAFPGVEARRHPFKLVVDFRKPFLLPGRSEPISRLYLRYGLGYLGVHAYQRSPDGRLARIAGSIWIDVERCIREVSAHQLIAARRRIMEAANAD